MIFFPNCKINIGLDILSRRTDGFHEIETGMYPVSGLCDILEIVPARVAGAEFSQSGIILDSPPENNLCIRAYEMMERQFAVGGVKIHLHKVIPAGAGLGGGSSDAAFTLKALNKIFSLALDNAAMERLAAGLGSDTAFFIRNEPQLASGRGEILTPCTIGLSGKRIVIVKPDIHISTAEAYAGVAPHTPAKPLAERIAEGRWKENVANAFEPSLFARYPELALIKRSLYDCGAEYASLSGSGSAVYGIFGGGGKVIAGLKKKFDGMFVYQQLIV